MWLRFLYILLIWTDTCASNDTMQTCTLCLRRALLMQVYNNGACMGHTSTCTACRHEIFTYKYMHSQYNRCGYARFTFYLSQQARMVVTTRYQHVPCPPPGQYRCKCTIMRRVWAVQVHVQRVETKFSSTSTCCGCGCAWITFYWSQQTQMLVMTRAKH